MSEYQYYEFQAKESAFKRKLITLSQAHYRKVTFMIRVQRAGLSG